tara:strand:- start:7762 stop:8469 length:708 start_codon:yes stop_codon:yes gene_type:complete
MFEAIKPTEIVGVSFWLLMLAMSATTVFLFMERRRAPARWQSSIALVAAITLISALHYYFLTGIWATTKDVSTAHRFMDWQLTAPMLVVVFFFLLRAVASVSAALFWRFLVSSTVMIAAAYLGAADYISPTLGFLVALAGGLYILGELYLGEASKVNLASGNETAQSAFNVLRLIATIGWAIYPLGYFMEYLGGGVDMGSINLIYNLADFLNKIAFALVIHWVAFKDPDVTSHRL